MFNYIFLEEEYVQIKILNMIYIMQSLLNNGMKIGQEGLRAPPGVAFTILAGHC